jgi:hypothetical protein
VWSPSKIFHSSRLCTYLQTLDLLEKAWQEQTF